MSADGRSTRSTVARVAAGAAEQVVGEPSTLNSRLVEQRLLGRPRGEQQRRRDAVQSARGVDQPAQRGRVRPVDVVDHGDQRRQVDRRPAEAVQLLLALDQRTRHGPIPSLFRSATATNRRSR
jgi:hypothetical protein